MTYKKHLQVVPTNQRIKAQLARNRDLGDPSSSALSGNYSSYLPEVYSGSPMRLERYEQYDQMDSDSEVNAALDTIADFSTQKDNKTDESFKIIYRKEASETEVEILKNCLMQWSKVNDFKKRIWRIFRNVLKYGDQFFIRDPETLRWFWVDPRKVDRILVNEAEGKQPEAYIFADLDINLNSFTATAPEKYGNNLTGGNSQMALQRPSRDLNRWGHGSSQQSRFSSDQSLTAIEAVHVVHLSLSEGLDANWPFGTSILESVYKTYREKGLLEEAVIIYRIQRAPERRVFYIDVGGMPLHKVGTYLEKVKNEIHQRRFPSRTGGGANVADATYNPMCLSFDTRIPLLDGRTLSLRDLITEYESGKENWVYSCDPITGKVVPGNITWAGQTRSDAKVIKITLDNGETFTCTPDHKIPVLNKGFVEAQHLTPQDSLIAFNRQYKSMGSNPKNTYERVFDHDSQSWKFTHRIVAEFFKDREKHQTFTFSEDLEGAEKNTVHHSDYNRHNNDPRNLRWMNAIDHRLFHSHVKKEWWEALSSDRAEEIKSSIRKSLEETRSQYTDEDKLRISQACSEGQQKRWNSTDRSSAEFNKTRQKISNVRQNYLMNNPNAIEQLRKNFREQQTKPWANAKFFWSHEMIKYMVEKVCTTDLKEKDAISLLNSDHVFMDLMRDANIDLGITKNINVDKFTKSKLIILYRNSGYKNWEDFKNKSKEFNHRITSIEWLDESMNVGTITVDGQERWHAHHTFAIESGIFVKNSMMEDFFFAQSCLDLSTLIPLLDGRTLTLQEIIDEYNEGKVNYVYSQNTSTHVFEPGKIVWADKTRLNAEVLKVTLDNGETNIVTPDHRFILRDGSEIEAQYLKTGDSLMPHILKDGYTGPNQKKALYSKYVCNATGRTRFVHIDVADKKPGKQTHVHHIDFNTRNNNPENLIEMDATVHYELHRDHSSYHMQKAWQDPDKRKNIIQGMRRLYDERDSEFDIRPSQRNLRNGSKTWQNPQSASSVLKALRINSSKAAATKKIQYSKDMYDVMSDLFDQGYQSISTLSPALRSDSRFQQAFRNNNPNIKRQINNSSDLDVRDSTLNCLVRLVGFKTFGDWKQDRLGLSTKFSNRQNHKVVSVERLNNRIDTGDITIETKSGSHIFALASGIFVHNSEGRGSRVDTLPAGENLGQIDDLKFWTNKLLRGLRVPSSYLPTGPDDGTQSFTDGRVGTAYIQEFRFAQYCQRLQNLISSVFDDEFKLFVRRRGFNIDSSLYELNFNSPENFGVYAKIERDAAAISIYQPLVEMKWFSKRWLMINKLGMNEDEINENERMWREENKDLTKSVSSDDSFGGAAPAGLDSVGMRPNDDIENDIGSDDPIESPENNDASPISGEENLNTDDGEDA